MKILNVSTTIDSVTGGGEAERTTQMSKYLAQSGADCVVLTIDTGGLNAERKSFLAEGKVIALPCLLRRFYIPKFSFRALNELIGKADIVHLMGHWTFLNALVYLIIRKQKKPYVVCPAGSLSIFGRSKILKSFYNFIIGRKIIRNASMCIAVTPDEVRNFISYGVQKNRISVIPNGVAQSDFIYDDEKHFREKYELGARPFILFIGRLNLIKGPDLLLHAFCKLKNQFAEIDLVFAGPDCGMLAELRNVVKIEGLEDRVHFVGYLGGIEKSMAYHAATILAIPSRKEAMSIVALEAGICGTPVLLTDQCGFNQIAEVGGGWVVPASIDGLYLGLQEVLSNSDAIGRSAVNVKKYVKEHFSWESIVQEYWQLYSVLLSRASNEN